jgi:hypothetical protein
MQSYDEFGIENPATRAGSNQRIEGIIRRMKVALQTIFAPTLRSVNMHGILIATGLKKEFSPRKGWSPAAGAETKFVTAMICHFGLSGKFCLVPAPIVAETHHYTGAPR